MVINLEPVFQNENSRQAFDFSFALEAGDIPDAVSVSEVAVTGEVVNRTGLVSIEAKAVFTFRVACARCAKPVARKMTVPIRQNLVAVLSGDDDDGYYVVENLRVNVDELVREQLLLQFPGRILCSADCKGLCASCGKDLNEGPCSCKKSIDPRLAALADLLDND